MEFNVSEAAEFLGVARNTLYKWLNDGKLASLSYEDVKKYIYSQVEADLKRKYALELVNDTSPSPVPPTSPDTSLDTLVEPTSLDTSHTPAPMEQAVVSSSPSWFGNKNPWTDEELEKVPVSSSPKTTAQYLEEIADQVEAAQASKKKKYFS